MDEQLLNDTTLEGGGGGEGSDASGGGVDVILACENMEIPFTHTSRSKSIQDYIRMGLTFAAMDINQRKRRKPSWKRHFTCMKRSKRDKEQDSETNDTSTAEPNNRDTITLEDIQNVGITIDNENPKTVVHIKLTEDSDLNKKWFAKAIKQLALHRIMLNFELA